MHKAAATRHPFLSHVAISSVYKADPQNPYRVKFGQEDSQQQLYVPCATTRRTLPVQACSA